MRIILYTIIATLACSMHGMEHNYSEHNMTYVYNNWHNMDELNRGIVKLSATRDPYLLEYLLNEGYVSPDSHVNGRPMLEHAFRFAAGNNVLILLRHGADISIISDEYKRASINMLPLLYYCILWTQHDNIDHLISIRAPRSCHDANTGTAADPRYHENALHWAARYGDSYTFFMLVYEHPEDMYVHDAFGYTPIDIVIHNVSSNPEHDADMLDHSVDERIYPMQWVQQNEIFNGEHGNMIFTHEDTYPRHGNNVVPADAIDMDRENNAMLLELLCATIRLHDYETFYRLVTYAHNDVLTLEINHNYTTPLAQAVLCEALEVIRYIKHTYLNDDKPHLSNNWQKLMTELYPTIQFSDGTIKYETLLAYILRKYTHPHTTHQHLSDMLALLLDTPYDNDTINTPDDIEFYPTQHCFMYDIPEALLTIFANSRAYPDTQETLIGSLIYGNPQAIQRYIMCTGLPRSVNDGGQENNIQDALLGVETNDITFGADTLQEQQRASVVRTLRCLCRGEYIHEQDIDYIDPYAMLTIALREKDNAFATSSQAIDNIHRLLHAWRTAPDRGQTSYDMLKMLASFTTPRQAVQEDVSHMHRMTKRLFNNDVITWVQNPILGINTE